jgi:hypothetical protein
MPIVSPMFRSTKAGMIQLWHGNECTAAPVVSYQQAKGCAVLAATDVEVQELYNEGVRWRGSSFKTRAEAQAALESLKSDLSFRSGSTRR